MDEDVPLLIPEINHEHIGLIEKQRENRGFGKGFIVTNPNCAVMSFAPPLAALDRRFGVESAIVTTLQAISGAGYPGVSSMDISDNVLPYIAGEEPKVETEAQKILGKFADGVVKPIAEISFNDQKDRKHKVKFVTTSIDTLTIAGHKATLTGSGIVNGETVTFRIVVKDNDPDRFSIELSNGYKASGSVSSGKGIRIKTC